MSTVVLAYKSRAPPKGDSSKTNDVLLFAFLEGRKKGEEL